MQRCVLRVVVLVHWVVVSPVVGHQEGPSPLVTGVLVTSVQHIAVEEEAVSRVTLQSNTTL